MTFIKIHKLLTIDFRITEKCNYSCSYCSPNDWRKQTDLLYTDKLLINLLNIIKVLNENKQQFKFEEMKLLISGGEPSLINIKKYTDLFRSITNKQLSEVVFSTNFSADNSYYITLIEMFNAKNIKFKIDAAYHSYGMKFEDFWNKALEIYNKYPNNIKMHFTFDDNNFVGLDNVYKVIDSGIDYNIKKVISKVNQNTDSYNVVQIKNNDLEYLLQNQSKIRKERHRSKGIKDVSNKQNESYLDEQNQQFSRDQIRDLDLSKDNAICMNHTITIMNGDIMVNCEYMRKAHSDRILVYNLLGKIFTKDELKSKLINVICMCCDKDGKTCRGGNCHPLILTQSNNALNIYNDIIKLQNKLIVKQNDLLKNI